MQYFKRMVSNTVGSEIVQSVVERGKGMDGTSAR